MKRSACVFLQTREFRLLQRKSGAKDGEESPRTAACKLDISSAAGIPLPATSAMHSPSVSSAEAVGGDYFDVLPLAEDTLGLCIADVAGTGIPAALLMSILQAAGRGVA